MRNHDLRFYEWYNNKYDVNCTNVKHTEVYTSIGHIRVSTNVCMQIPLSF